MAVILKPRSNKEGLVEATADLTQLNGRPEYKVLVKDIGIFEWVASGSVDNENIFQGGNGLWSRIIQSAESLIAYTPEDVDNKSTDVIDDQASDVKYPSVKAVYDWCTSEFEPSLGFTPEDSDNKSLDVVADGASDVKYPSVKATKSYADSLVTGLLDDRGNFTPDSTSPGAWPTTGGSGTAGAIMKGDIWFCDASGFMGTTAVVSGATFRAIVDSPGQTDANWNVLSAGAINVPTPTLGEVTAAGNTTTSNITVENNATFSTIKVNSTGGNGTAEMGHDPIFKGYLRLNNGTNDAVLRANNLTSSRLNIQLPNANGTLALTSQITTPSLSQVTAVGNTSSESIAVSKSGGGTIGVEDTLDLNKYGFLRNDISGSSGILQLGNTNGTRARLRADNVTANRDIQLPDESGTLALTSQIGGEPYKVYTASFTISLSGVSSLTVFRNTIGNGSGDGVNDIAWTGNGVDCNATMTGSTAFPSGKTWIQSTNYISGGVSYGFYGRRVSNTQVRYSSILTSTNAQGAGFSSFVFVEIRVYP